VHNADWQNPAVACVGAVAQALGASDAASAQALQALGSFDADAMANKLMGDTLYVNPITLGYAWQKGWIPLGLDSLMRAMELNGVAVDNNKAAFAWGRRAAHDIESVNKLLNPGQVIEFKKRDSLDDVISYRAEFLVGYQNAAYAERYKAFVSEVKAKELAVMGPTKASPLSEAVAKGLFKLMAYKDEYEVARLHTDATFHSKIASQFEGDYKLHFHLAPPLTGERNEKGELRKKVYGPSMLTGFKLLAKLKGLRGTAWDVFGRTDERKTERALISEYEACVRELLQSLSPTNHVAAVEIARIPELIKGYGHVKHKNLAVARTKWDGLMTAWRQPASGQKAA
jgi:indolepyruvate ferredoxin oxidoreductase